MCCYLFYLFFGLLFVKRVLWLQTSYCNFCLLYVGCQPIVTCVASLPRNTTTVHLDPLSATTVEAPAIPQGEKCDTQCRFQAMGICGWVLREQYVERGIRTRKMVQVYIGRLKPWVRLSREVQNVFSAPVSWKGSVGHTYTKDLWGSGQNRQNGPRRRKKRKIKKTTSRTRRQLRSVKWCHTAVEGKWLWNKRRHPQDGSFMKKTGTCGLSQINLATHTSQVPQNRLG